MKSRIFLLAVMLMAFLVLPKLKADMASFSISQIDASAFPLIRAGFVALDASGNPYTNLLPGDFVLKENGQNMAASLQVSCHDSVVDPSASIILVVDQSGSMNWLNDSNQTRWSWVLEGASSFIKTIKMTNGTQVALISFGKVSYIRCPFTQDKKRLLDSLDKTNIGGGTLYEPPILDPETGALYMFNTFSQDIHKRRIIIFLTDGDPNDPPKTDSLIKMMHLSNVQFYAITLAMPMNTELAKMSSQTGGKAYAVYSKKDLNDIYTYIALEIQKQQFCDLIWTAPYGCVDASRTRQVNVVFNKQPDNINDREYIAPLTSIGKTGLSDNLISFGDPPLNNSADQYFTIKAVNSPLHVTNVTCNPPTYFSILTLDTSGVNTTVPFTIDTGKPQTMKLRFTQGSAKAYRQATLVVEGDPCPPLVPMVGGISQIRIVTPNGGEVLSSCDSILIQWAGIEPTKPVNLSYSTDNGVSWLPLANNVTGFAYKWKPPQPSQYYRIKGTVSAVSSFQWAKNEGGSGVDEATSLACLKNDYYFYVTGSYEGTMTINGKNLISKGGRDIFLAKYDRDGNNIWAYSGGGQGTDTANGVCVDIGGNAYVVGTAMNSCQFGSIIPNLVIDNAPFCFLAKYPPNGQNPAVAFIGPNNTWTNFKAWGLKVRYVANTPPALDEIYVQGQYIGQFQNSIYTFPKVATPTRFTAIFNPDLTVRTVSQGGIDYPDYSSTTDNDPDGNKYNCGYFSNKISFGPFNLTSNGKVDLFINKFGGTPGSSDVCDTSFQIVSPQLTVKNSIIDLKNCTLGSFGDTVVNDEICNAGMLLDTIATAIIIGPQATEFKLGSTLVGQRLNPGACIPVEILFTPKDIGSRNAQLIISDGCTAQAIINLTGTGVCSGIAHQLVDYGNVTLNTKKDSLITCLFLNTNTSPIDVKPVISGTNAVDFALPDNSTYLVSPDSCITIKVAFTPSAPGLRQANVDFQSQSCTLPSAQLQGNAVDADINIRAVDWGGRRIMTQNDTFTYIKNNGFTAVTVKYIDLAVKTTSTFEILNGNVPFTINPNDSFKVNLRFSPTAEIHYGNTLLLAVDNRTDTLSTSVTGDGILPKLTTAWQCGNTVKPGDMSTGMLDVSNPSTTADLFISKLQFSPVSADFNWDAGVQTTNITIPKGETKTFNVVFTPQAVGNRTAKVILTSDAAPGPNQNPLVDTSFTIACDAVGLNVNSELDFGALMICDVYMQNIKVHNSSSSSDVTILSYYFEGADSVVFSVAIPGKATVPPNGDLNIPVKFTPLDSVAYTVKLHIIASDGIEIIITLKGNGQVIRLYANPYQVNSYPGLNKPIPVIAKIPAFNKPTVNSLKITVKFDVSMLQCIASTFQNKLQNWTWSTPDPALLAKGVLQVVGTGAINVPFEGPLFSVNYRYFLSDHATSKMTFSPDQAPCPSPVYDGATVGLENVCFLDGTLIVSDGFKYALEAPEPNPSSNSVNIRIGVGLTAPTTLEVYNTMGELVKTILDENVKAGEYEMNVQVSDLSSGVYLIKMVSGPFTKTETMVISK